jgi:hypothetical protein
LLYFLIPDFAGQESIIPCSIGFTLGEYFALPDDEQDQIWDEAEAEVFDWDELEEVEVSPDVLAFSYSIFKV